MHRVTVSPVPPSRLSFFSRLSLPLGTTEMNICAEEIKDLVTDRAEGVQEEEVFEEAPADIGLDLYPHSRPSRPLDLHPRVPVFTVTRGYDFMSGAMEEFCRKHPISIIRGLPQAMGIDMSTLSVDALAKVHPQMDIKVLTQKKQAPDSNKDSRGMDTWELESEEDTGTLRSQVEYMKKEEEKEGAAGGKKAKKDEKIHFGIANLSDHPLQFAQQLQELQRLPLIFRPGQPTDLLSLMGDKVPGLTGIYSFLKVNGVRTSAHEEDGGIPSINLSVGPGTSRWMACELAYVEKVEEACKSKGLVYAQSAIWPNLREMEALGVPIFSFSQLPGDVVHTGPGTLHWVEGQSVGCNYAWNCGPLSKMVLKHWKWQVERNRAQRLFSSIPIERTSWRIAAMGRVWDQEVFFELRGILVRSLAHLYMVEEWLKECGVGVMDMAASEKEKRFDCDECLSETFNVVFTAPRGVTRCYSCMQQNGGMQAHTPRRQRPMSTLEGIFDAFRA